MSPWDILEDEFGSCRILHQQFHRAVGKLLPRMSEDFILNQFLNLSELGLSIRLHFYVAINIIIIIMSKEGEEIKPQNEPVQNMNENIERSASSSSSSSRSNSQQNNDKGGSSSGSESSNKQDADKDRQGGERKIVRYKYCCKICKHPDKSKRACVCVVPLSQRRADLGSGCRNCGCMGCSKQDFISKGEDPEYHPQQPSQVRQRTERPRRTEQPPKRQQKEKRYQRRERSTSRKRNKSPKHVRNSRSSSRSRSPEYIDSVSMKFYNFDRSLIGGMIINEYQLNPILLGFAVPQRTYSYILGRPK